jgi:hypothetical protein
MTSREEQRALLLDTLLLRAVTISRAWHDPRNQGCRCVDAHWWSGGIATTWERRP